MDSVFQAWNDETIIGRQEVRERLGGTHARAQGPKTPPPQLNQVRPVELLATRVIDKSDRRMGGDGCADGPGG